MESTVGPEGNLVKPRPESCRQINITYPIIDNDQLAKLRHIALRGFESVTLPMLYRSEEGGAGLERALDELRARASEAVKAGHTILIISDRGVSRSSRHPQPARDCRRAPSPGTGRHTHAVRPRHRVRRRARSAPCGAPGRLRRRGGQSVPGVRNARRHDPAARPGGDHARARRVELHQGPEQGDSEGHVEDGHLDAAELLRRPDLRGHRARSGFHRSLFHVDGVPHRRRRHRSGGGGSPAAARARLPDAQRRLSGPGCRRGIPVAPRRRAPSLQSGDRFQAPARDALGTIRDLSGVHRTGERPEPEARHAPRPAEVHAGTSVPLDEVEPVESIVKRFATGAMSYGSISQERTKRLRSR